MSVSTPSDVASAFPDTPTSDYGSSNAGHGIKVLVTGSRHWTNDAVIRLALGELPSDAVIIHGDARGADTLVHIIAVFEYRLRVIAVPADWNRHGKAAGMIRNRKMLDMKPDVVLAFPLPDSVGTRGCITEAKRRGIPVKVYDDRTDAS